MVKYPTLFFLLLLSAHAFAQIIEYRIDGSLVDESNGEPMVGATVLMVNIKDSTRSRFSVSDIEGKFIITDLEKAFYKLRISSTGYEDYTKVLRVTTPIIDLGVVRIKPDLKVLDEILIEGQVVAVQQIGDTTQYNADAFKTNPDASASDLVSKMPGIVVDSEGVTANGESIEQVLLDGKRFFGQDPLLSLNTIPADVVDKVQVYDELSDQSQLTGFDDGNTTKTMNVVTKEDKRNGQFGKLYAGGGESELYKAGVTINSFAKDKRITILGMSNNINQQNFGSEDLVGVSGGGGRGGFRRGGNQNFITGTQDGITRTNAGGLNFTDDWGENTTFEGSYFFNQSHNDNDQLLNRESFLNDGSQLYTEDQQKNTENLNHRLNVRINHKLNSNDNLLIRSSISYQNNEGNELTNGVTVNDDGQVLNQTFNNYISLNRSINFNNNLAYQHKFKKIGRTISSDLTTLFNPTIRENTFVDIERDSLIAYGTEENEYVIGYGITYTEPLGVSAQLALRYEINHTGRASDTETFTQGEASELKTFNETLSNNFESGYTKNLSSIRYSNNKFGNHLDVALAYQYATLDNNQISPVQNSSDRSFSNILPSFLVRFDMGENSNLFMRYATSTTEPTISQLQNVLNNSDPLFLSIGNPGLNQTYSHSFNVRFRHNIIDKNIILSNSTRLVASQDYISTSTSIIESDSIANDGLILAEGAQVSLPVNLDGYWSINNNTTYSFLIAQIKNNLNTSLGISYVRQPGLTNNILNISNTYSANLKVGLVSNISEKVDYNLYYQISAARVNNSIQSETNSEYYSQTLGTKLNLIFPKGFVFRNETLFQKYNGINDFFDTDYTLWNIGIAKKFLKNDSGEIELSVFDLLGENQSFDQTVTAQYVQETQTQVLQRYFMLTFTYQLRHFN